MARLGHDGVVTARRRGVAIHLVYLEVDATGGVKGVATDPKSGLADMSAVAGCVTEKAKTWKLPKRGMPGTTRIKLVYTMSPRK